MSERLTIREATPADVDATAALEYESAIHHASIDPARWRVLPGSASRPRRAAAVSGPR